MSNVNGISKINGRSERMFLLLAVLIIFALLIPVCSATSIQKFSIDSKTYAANETISVSGEILDGNASGEIRIIIQNSENSYNKTVYATDSSFSTTINAPSNSGEYSIVAVDIESGSTSPYLNFNVLGVNDPKTIKVILTEGEILTVPLSSSPNITGPLATDKTGGNVTYDGKTYYFLVSDDNIAYADDDNDMNLSSDNSGMSVIGNLVEGSKIKLNSTTYTLVHIHNDTEIVLAHTINPTFSGGESVNVTLLALNASNVPLSDTNVTLEYVKDDGTSILNTTLMTGTDGVITTNISVVSDSGVYHLIAGDVGHISFTVNTVDIFGDILSSEYKPKHTFARGENLTAVVYLKNKTTGVPISSATVTAKISGATNTSSTQNLALTYDSNISAYTCTYKISNDAVIDTYNVEYTAVNNSQTQKAFTTYSIKAYDLFLKAISKENEDSDGFAVGKEGFLILAGTNLSSGDKLNIEDITGLDKNQFKVNITDSTGSDVTSNWSIMNISTFYAYKAVPSDVQEEIKKRFGENLTIINFTAPSTNGIYEILVQVNLSGWAKVRTSISVQDLFVHGEPVNKNGWFSPEVAPGAYARLIIMAFDPSTGEMLSASAINEAGLVEVWSESASDVVTQYMLNATLEEIEIPFMGTVKILKFQVNDQYLGFHHVKFWVNATVDGTPKMVIGDGWFDEKLYTIRAKPTWDANSEMFKVFGADDKIQLDVSVEDVSGNSVTDAIIEIDSVKYGMTGENVPFTVNTSSSFSTDSSGTVTIEFDPTGSLKSGFYNVRLKMTTQDGVTDYGNGWFEVSNFIFCVYSTSWDVGINKSINFTLNAFDSEFNDKNVNVTLTKIISLGDWEMMTPPSVYNDTPVSVGNINGAGYYGYPGLSKGGNYEFVFEANDGNSTEVGRAWVHVTPFIAWVDANQQYEFSINDFINFTVEASDDMWWGGTPHNITNVSVEKVMQEGMWMTTYRNKTAMEAITTTENVSSQINQINVSINTTGWGQGSYSMILKVTDNESNEVYTQFWFQLKLASVTVPKLMRVNINGGQYHTNATSINATTDIMSKKDKFASLGNVSAGKVSGIIVNDDPAEAVTMIVSSGMDSVVLEGGDNAQVPYFAMVVVDTVHKTVYIEYVNQTPGGGIQYYNLSDSTTTQVFNASAGDTFTDYTGRMWRIKEITDDGTVKLEGINALRNGLIMDQSVMSLSKSGKFLMGTFRDEEGLNVDLYGDGKYDNWYNILLIDANIPGKYDTVYISNTSNFSSGTYIDASAGTGIEFGGDPIYLLSNKYQSGTYMLEFTTYQKGWPGMYLGTYANGSVVKIPFLVLKPDGTPVSGSKVTIDFLMDESRYKYPLSGINKTTDTNGLAIISINTTEYPIQTGAWMIHYNASIDGGYAVADEEMFWEMTRFELRNFVVSGALGIPGSIDLIQLSDSDTSDGKPGYNMLLSYGDEIEFKRGIGLWGETTRYQLEYPFDNWFYNSTTEEFNYSMDGGFTLLPGNGTLINSSSARNIITYNVTSINNTGDQIVLHSGINRFYDNMWIFNVTNIAENNTIIAMSYVGWPWTLPGDPQSPGPEVYYFRINDSRWMGGLDFRVVDINASNDTVILKLNRPVLVANVESMQDLMDGNLSNGELDKMRGSVNRVNFSGREYLVYGYEDKANISADSVDWASIDTMDRVVVENISSGKLNVYSIGKPIPELNNYYVASVPKLGGKLVLLNNSTTQVFPIPQWGADEPIYYVGKFSDVDLGVDLALLGTAGGPDMPKGNITSDDRYSILMFDALPNGISFPTQAIYDDDSDLTNLGGWGCQLAYDMYGPERGYNDSLESCGFIDSANLEYINMSERFAWGIGTGNMENWPMAIPKIEINETTKNATAKTFALLFDVNKSDNITIYVTAKDFEGTQISGTVELKQLNMLFGGNFDEGFFDDLPKTWNLTSGLVNATLVEGEALLTMTFDDLPDDLKSGGTHDFDFGEFAAVIEITDDSGRTETLKTNFFMIDYANMPDEPISGIDGGGSGGML